MVHSNKSFMRFKIVVNPNGLFLFVVTGKSSVIGLHGLLPMIGHRTIIHFGSKVKEVPGSRLWKYQCTLARNLIRIRFWWIGLLRVSPNCCTRIPFNKLITPTYPIDVPIKRLSPKGTISKSSFIFRLIFAFSLLFWLKS